MKSIKSSFILLLLLPIVLSAQSNARPNFLIIMADDCTARDMEVYGGPALVPHIKKLAEEGIIFNQCFQSTAMCTPTRSSLLTGLYPVKNGAYYNHSYTYSDTVSIAKIMTENGYRTVLTGKRHISPESVYPFEYTQEGEPDLDFIENVVNESISRKEPFCAFIMSTDPHVPWSKGLNYSYTPGELELPPYLFSTIETQMAYARYLSEISYFDEVVGQSIAILQKHGILDNTVVMILGEHGNLFPFEKWTCYDAGLRSALVIRYPEYIKEKSVSNSLVEYVDIVPTILEIADIDHDYAFDGNSFLEVLRNPERDHKQYVFGVQTTLGVNEAKYPYAIRSVRDKQYKLIIRHTIRT